jgi:tripartite-type tricarboxylate transporter receptor subunit TctC
MRTLTSLAAATVALCLLAPEFGWSQGGRNIKLLVPASPGASTDFVARLSADHISRTQSVTAVVENRPGANGMIGVGEVARSAPDGNTLLVTANTYLLDDLLRKPSYHPVTSFEPICHLVQTPAVLAVHAESPYRTLADFINAAREKPGALSLAAVGPGSTFQLGLIDLMGRAKINVTFVPYPGSAPAVTALVGQHVTSVISGYAVVAEHIKAGKLRALAAATAKRIAPAPDVPTFDELGFKGLEIENSFGVVAPVKTPKDVIAQFTSWFTAAIQAPDSQAKLAAQYLYTGGPCGDTYAAQIRKSHDAYEKLIKEAGIKVQ